MRKESSDSRFEELDIAMILTYSLGRQFGNMLVLSATFMSSLQELVEPEQLRRLLVRTIGFLVQSENISPTLRADARILTQIYTKIFDHPPDLTQANGMSSHTPSLNSHTPSLSSQTTSMSFP